MATKPDEVAAWASACHRPTREAFMAEHGAKQFVDYGAAIAEHLEVPEAVLDRAEELGASLAKSRDYTDSLPPKKDKRR